MTRSPLRYADAELLARLNTSIAAGTLLTRISDSVTEPLQAGLVNADSTLLYRIDAKILTLLASEAIEIWEHNEPA